MTKKSAAARAEARAKAEAEALAALKAAKAEHANSVKRRAQASFEQDRRDRGEVKTTVWFTKETWEALQRLKAEDGTIGTSIQIAIQALDLKRRAKRPMS